MLGTLAKWLRILGYDTLFDPALDDHQLVRLARAENRVLLTRDRELGLRRGVHVLLVASEHLDNQIRQVLVALELVPDRSFSRCPVCNEPLEMMDRQAAQARVPAYVAQTHEIFRHCPACHRIYWRGTHWKQMDQRLAEIRSHGAPPGATDVSEPNSA
jgi:uncharacterized protein with PIN domain